MVRSIRNLRAEFRIQPNQSVEAIVDAPEIRHSVEAEANAIRSLAQVDPLRTGPCPLKTDRSPSGNKVSLVLSRGTVTVPLEGLVDLDQERRRLSKELEQLDANLKRLQARLSDSEFRAKAPEEVVERERQRLVSMEDRRARVVETVFGLQE